MRIPLLALLVATPLVLSPAVSAAQRKSSRPSPPPPSHPSSETEPSSAVPIVRTAAEVDTVDRVVAVVGSNAITWNELVTVINQQRAQGAQFPSDPAGQLQFAQHALGNMIDEEILVQKAGDLKLTATDDEITHAVDNQMKQIRSQFKDEIEFRGELKNAGFGTVEEYRKTLTEQARRYILQQRAFAELRKTAKPVGVSEDEVNAAFEEARPQLQKRPPLITFRQLVIAPKPSPRADSVALAKAESLLVQLKKGADFAELAKRESMDAGSRDSGGDLGWARRGTFVPEFESVVFALRPGTLGPIVKTQFGYHIIRVDRVRPGEVKARHILIIPTLDSNDVKHTLVLADSVAQLWRNGANYDSLVTKYHDPVEEKAALTPQIIDSLPDAYRTALQNAKANEVVAPFVLQAQNGATKYAVVQVLTRTGYGEYSLPEIRQQIRTQLAAEKQSREILDDLRKQTYVSIRL